MRTALGTLALALAASASPAAHASKPARACIEAHADGQVERDAGRLLAASERFRACASDQCPAVIRKDCGSFEADLEPRIPSVLLSADDGSNRAIAGARAIIDGATSVPALDGTAIPLDPGVHEIEVVLADGRRQLLHVSLAVAEKSRRVRATFVPREPPPRSDHTLAYVLGGAGLVALGAWGAFAWDGRRRQSELEGCAPHCTDPGAVDTMRQRYLIADILLGVSAVTLGTSTYILLTSDGQPGQPGRSLMVGASGRF